MELKPSPSQSERTEVSQGVELVVIGITGSLFIELSGCQSFPKLG